MESAKGKHGSTGPPAGVQPAKAPAPTPNPLLHDAPGPSRGQGSAAQGAPIRSLLLNMVKSRDDGVQTRGWLCAIDSLNSGNPPQAVSMTSLMQAASASINKLLGVQTLTTSQQKLALVLVSFLGTAAKGSRVLPGTLRSLAAPMFEIVLRAAATAPPELKADTKQAMQLLAGVFSKAPGVFAEPAMSAVLERVSRGNEAGRAAVCGTLALTLRALLNTPGINADNAKELAGAFVGFVLHSYSRLAPLSTPVELDLVPEGCMSFKQLAAQLQSTVLGLRQNQDGSFSGERVAELASQFNKVKLADEADFEAEGNQADQGATVEAAATSMQKHFEEQASTREAVRVAMEEHTAFLERLIKLRKKFSTKAKEDSSLLPFDTTLSMAITVAAATQHTFIPKVASRLYTVQLDLMEVALTRTVSFCRKLEDRLTQAVQAAQRDNADIAVACSALLLVLLELLPLANVFKEWSEQVTGTITIVLSEQRRVSEGLLNMPSSFLRGTLHTPERLAQRLFPGRVQSSAAASAVGSLLDSGYESTQELLSQVNESDTIHNIAILPSSRAVFDALVAAPYDDYALVVHARKDLYPHADVANEYNAVLGSTKIDTLALQCLRHLFRAACPLDAVRAMHDALRAALRNANRAVRGDEEAITFLMGPYPFLLESTSWCDMLVGMRLLDEEGSELAQKCIDLTDDIYAKIEESAALSEKLEQLHKAMERAAQAAQEEAAAAEVPAFDVYKTAFIATKEGGKAVSNALSRLQQSVEVAMQAGPAAAAACVTQLLASARKMSPLARAFEETAGSK